MSSKTTYRCDSCYKDITVESKNRVTINQHTLFYDKPSYDFDVCEECLELILGFFNKVPKKAR